jgi:hypothetical protein
MQHTEHNEISVRINTLAIARRNVVAKHPDGLFMHVTSGSGSHLNHRDVFFLLNGNILYLSLFSYFILKYNNF